MRRRFLVIAVLSFVFLWGCQHKLTQIFQRHQDENISSQVKILKWTEKTIVLDARPAFLYGLGHFAKAYPIRAVDFLQIQEPFRGYIQRDTFEATRRLARMGIGKETPVIIVGRGLQGEGEEGQMAWILRSLGVKNVSFASVDYFRRPLTREKRVVTERTSSWRSVKRGSLSVVRKDVLATIAKNVPSVLLDVRTEEEYLVSSLTDKTNLNMGAINISWENFFDRLGRPNIEVLKILQGVEIFSDKKIIVISREGKRSAAVTMVLRSLGYKKVFNYPGGVKELMTINRP